ncbi:unnamed protein product [Ilex paraguariensis]|uniref:SCP domain-containing protein n=1 Tax=Ilex paraguariensis TaxID=185542 RepID=A0ABC8T8Z7_9AQUA
MGFTANPYTMESPHFRRPILLICILSSHLLPSLSTGQFQKTVSSIIEAASNAIDEPTKLIDSTISEQQEFLAAHNKVRLHALEPPFVWDLRLAIYARLYAQQRAGDCELVHSNGQYGENIFWGSGNLWTPSDVVRLWVKEHRYYDRRTNECLPGEMCGHYTQIVWRESVRLGCARIECNNGDTFAICSYDPPGNYIGESPFDDNR